MDGSELGEGSMKIEVIEKEKLVYMWGYLPGAMPQRSPLLSPIIVRIPQLGISNAGNYSWKDVCGGGCGFAMAISDSGKIITWGSTDDLGQCYVTSGKHGEIPEPFPLPDEISMVKAAAGWAHCVAVTETGEVYTWGWKECIPSGKFLGEAAVDKEGSRSKVGAPPGIETRGGEDGAKRRRVSSVKQPSESSSSGDEGLSALPCLVTLNPEVRIVSVAAGGRHTLALSDIGQVWGWGYGGEGQLGLGSRIRMVSSPHPVPCIDSSSLRKDRAMGLSHGCTGSEGQGLRVPGNYVKRIACGGRHSAVITDAGALLTFGWGLYGQCGQGSTDDELSPTCVSSLLGIRIESVAAGLWHTVCISADGDVYAFGGNQFGQLGTGAEQAETLPRLLDAPSLENMHVKVVSCGARHTAVVTGDSKVFCWGWNKYGQLGLGDVIDRNIPSQVSLDGHIPINVSCGWWHTLLLAESPT
ncbi:ultraviolet-B receptor UVR8 isoform X3 [Solanum dulcamara]|uniref:ultraviolet-B receptor UVR8 isoform X3 n=1 Tax=Solanum dulcamara TaxID=45834 RepID=UPI00248587AB|nr:ultraviolet-B receptor UVR8 isoform X3 [Solanum dulcamara]